MRDGSCCLLKTLNITTFLEKHDKLPAVFLWLELEVRALAAVRARGGGVSVLLRALQPRPQPWGAAWSRRCPSRRGSSRRRRDGRSCRHAAPTSSLQGLTPAWRFPARGGRSSPGACEVVFACCRDASASGYSYPRKVKRAPQPLLGHLSWENSCSLTGGILR